MDRSGRLGVELLLNEAGRLRQQGRYAEALRAAERAVEGARRLGELGLEIRAVTGEARTLYMLGDEAAALARRTWVLGVANDPARRAELDRADVAWEIADAYQSWADTARFLPEVPATELFGVVDAGEAYVQRIGRPGWRAGLLIIRSQILDALGRTEDAIGFAEEGLAFKQRDGSGPGATLATHRWSLGDLLRQVGRHEDARRQYEAVLENGPSDRHGCKVATEGLARCALVEGSAAEARRLAEQAVRLAEGMGADAAGPALDVLIEACRKAEDLPAARRAADRMLHGARRLGSGYRLYYSLRSAADVALDEGDASRAKALIDEAEPLAAALDRSRSLTAFRGEIERRHARLAELDTAPR